MKEQAEKLTSISRVLEDRVKFASNIRIDSESARRPVQDVRRRSSLGKKMLKTGLALTILPEPITVIPGVPLMVAGLAVDRTRSSIGLQDVSKDLHASFKELRNLTLNL